MSSAAPLIEPLDRRHEVQAFDCGQVALNDYLRRQATQDVRRDVNRVFVARIESSPAVIGYYSLSAASFGKRDLPADRARRLPHYPVPAALLGRLAVDKRQQGRGLGQYLMVDALWRVLRASEELALYALVVDAKDDSARFFYLRFGFLAFPETPSRLFMPLGTIRQVFRADDGARV
jgi:GNAT superfamily N-acetyltransferase